MLVTVLMDTHVRFNSEGAKNHESERYSLIMLIWALDPNKICAKFYNIMRFMEYFP